MQPLRGGRMPVHGVCPHPIRTIRPLWKLHIFAVTLQLRRWYARLICPSLEILLIGRPGLANQSPTGVYVVRRNRPKADANFAPEPPGRSQVLGDAHVDVGEGPETPNNPDSSDRYVVLGDLVLPRPPAELKERAELYEKDLQALDARDMRRESMKREPSHQPANTLLELRGCPIINLNDTFREFQSREEKA